MSIALNGNGLITGAAFGDVPVFSAVPTAAQTVTTSIFTKIVLGTVRVDNKGWWSAVNNRYTPLQEGWYNVRATAMYQGTAVSLHVLAVYRNGSEYARLTHITPPASTANVLAGGSALIYMNGTTDYLEFFAYNAATGTAQVIATAGQTHAAITLYKAGA